MQTSGPSLWHVKIDKLTGIFGLDLEGEQVFSGLAKKVTISEKSKIFVLSSQNLVKITTSYRQFDQVSLG